MKKMGATVIKYSPEREIYGFFFHCCAVFESLGTKQKLQLVLEERK